MNNITITPARAKSLYEVLAIIAGVKQDMTMPNMFLSENPDYGTVLHLVDADSLDALEEEGWEVINDKAGGYMVILD